MNTTRTAIRRSAAAAVLAGAAVFAAVPSYAGTPPEDPVAADSSSAQGSGRASKAQIEHDEAITGSSGPGAQTKAQIERMEREMADRRSGAQPASTTSDPSDPSSVPVSVLALIGGSLVAGAAGFTVYRFRHHGPVGAATA